MSAKQFFDLVVNMRYAQREYFKTRDKEWLTRSLQYEKQVDEEIKRVEHILIQKQQ